MGSLLLKLSYSYLDLLATLGLEIAILRLEPVVELLGVVMVGLSIPFVFSHFLSRSCNVFK